MNVKIKLAELTSAEAKEKLNSEAVILIPMGSLEDQGTHAPMGDYLAAEAIALDMAKKSTSEGVPTFVTPVIPFGGKDWFDSSHGGVSLSHKVIVSILDEMFACFYRHGLKRIMIVNGHGGNVAPITEVTHKWRTEKDVFITSMYLWQIGYGLLPDLIGKENAANSSGHGGNPLTSVGMHYFPEILRPDLMEKPPVNPTVKGVSVHNFGALGYQGVPIQAPIEAEETAPHGVWGGDPHLCSKETGKALSERLIEIGCGFIKDHVSKSLCD